MIKITRKLPLDVEEAMLDRALDGQVDESRDLVAPAGGVQLCEHLEASAGIPEPTPLGHAKAACATVLSQSIYECV